MKASTAEDQRSTSLIMKFITLGIGNERYGIEISQIREIIARYDIVPLPQTPDFIEGMISLRGDIIPVVDLRKRFAMKAKERDDNTRTIVVELGEFTVGIQVDRVYEVLKLSESDIEPPPPLVSNLRAEYLVGVAEFQGNLITILNLEKIFSASEKSTLGTVEEDGEEGASGKGAAKPSASVTGGSRTAVVDDGGMLEFRGKEYFVGKKLSGKTLDLVEDGGTLSVSADGKTIKEFTV